MTTSPPSSFAVSRRFRGPALSGNGGYTAGRLALSLADPGEAATVTLRRPPPLDTPMSVRPAAAEGPDGGIELWYGDELVASASSGAFAAEVVAPVDFESATAARSSYRGATGHPFPGCFSCGPAREPGDGLRLTPGLVAPGRTACIWVPDPSLVTGDDPAVVGAEFAWAAVDCPGGWTSDLDARPLVLGRMTACCHSLPRVGHPHVVVGELLGEVGRKTFTAAGLYDDGRLVARAEHIWIAVDPATFNS